MAKITRRSFKKENLPEMKIPKIGQHELEMLKKARCILRQNDNYIFGCSRRRR